MDEAEERERAETIYEAVGGPLGIAEATLPFIVFTATWSLTGNDIKLGGIAAVSVAAVLAVARILKRETVQFALSGVVGVAFGAFVANRTGKAEDFFLPGLLINAGSAAAYLISIAVRRPLIGLIVSQLTGEGPRWYREEERRQAYSRASWIWVGIFCFRLSVQLPLYLTEAVGPLAVARVITGLPLFALGIWFTYALLRPVVGPLPRRAPG